MKTYDELRQQWNSCHGQGQVLVDSSHPLRMYLNINAEGNKEILIPVNRPEKRFKSTAAIGVRNYENKENKFLAIELLQPILESEYVCLCYDLIESSRHYPTRTESLKALFEALKKWYYLLADPKRDILPEREIRGLLGELQYMLDELTSGKDEQAVISAWKIHKDASRDFIFDDSWSEIKTVESTKDYITISSIEQLDHDTPGTLVVFKLDRTEETDPTGISLNGMVEEVRGIIGFQAETEFNQKILARGYTYNEQYDHLLFLFNGVSRYHVENDFPCITREMLPIAIIRAEYDLRLNQIERWRIDGQQ